MRFSRRYPFQRFRDTASPVWEEYELIRRDCVSGIIPDMPFTCENAKSMRARSHGLRRAAFWRALGFPNLVLARAVRQRNLALSVRKKAYLQGKKRAGLDALLNITRDDL